MDQGIDLGLALKQGWKPWGLLHCCDTVVIVLWQCCDTVFTGPCDSVETGVIRVLWHCFYSLQGTVLWYCYFSPVILLFQSCNTVVSILWYFVSVLWQCCDTAVIALWNWCDTAFKVLGQCCDTVDSILWYCYFSPATVLWHSCDNPVT